MLGGYPVVSVLRWLVGAAVFLALLVLSLDNAEVVTLKFFRVARIEAPLVLVVFVAFVLGVAIGLASGALRVARLKRQLKRARRESAAQSAVVSPAPHGAVPAPGTIAREPPRGTG